MFKELTRVFVTGIRLAAVTAWHSNWS